MKKLTSDDLDGKDHADVSRIINDMHATYREQVARAQSDVHEARRAMVQAEHKLNRLENRKAEIENYCQQYNVTLED